MAPFETAQPTGQALVQRQANTTRLFARMRSTEL